MRRPLRGVRIRLRFRVDGGVGVMVRTEGRGAGAHCTVRVDLVDLHGVVVCAGEEVPSGYRC